MAGAMNSGSLRIGLLATFLFYCSMTVLCAVQLQWQAKRQQAFFNRLPYELQRQYVYLQQHGLEHSEEAQIIRMNYQWPDNLLQLDWLFVGGIGLGGVVVGSGVGLYARRTFMAPMRSLSEAALRIAEGDYGVRAIRATSSAILGLQTNFNRMAEHLERLEYERKDTIAGISHELRTPLTILRGRLHALCDGVIPVSFNELQKLLTHTEHLVRLVEDVQTVTLGEGNRLSLHRIPMDFMEFLHECLPVYSDRLREAGVKLQLSGQSVRVWIDPDRMRQVLTNLVENVIRYASAGQVLEISVEHVAEEAILRVADAGPGISETVLERIFDPFFRTDHSRSRSTGGTGLGLAVVRTLVHQHGGSICASNRREGGAEFIIRLPLSTSEPREHDA